MTTKFTSVRLTEEAAADLRRWTGELMADSADGKVTMSEALRLAINRGREYTETLSQTVERERGE